MTYNPILYNTDSYKGTHYLGYPEGAEHIYSYLESRGGEYQEIVFLGLQKLIDDFIKVQITREQVLEAQEFWMKHVGTFNLDGWMRIVDVHNGYLPVLIRALPEGTVARPGIPLLTITNTDPNLPWLTSYLETVILRTCWYPTTVASRIRSMKKKIKYYYDLTSDNLDALPFALLDFSSRGCQTYESSEMGGYAYLTQFLGSDNVPAVLYTNKMFGEDMSGYSVPATEHSMMCSFTESNEFESFRYILKTMGKSGGILSVVSDTWDIYRAAAYWCELADEVKASGVNLVFRPDSGDPREVIPPVLSMFEKAFGYTLNSKDYKVLNGVKILWGDGIDEDTCVDPFRIAQRLVFSADNILVGSGGGLMAKDITRDTCKFAVKASAIRGNPDINGIVDWKTADGKWIGISKNPVTDSGKRSKEGVFFVYRDEEQNLQLISTSDYNYDEFRCLSQENELQTVFVDGNVTLDRPSLSQIRERSSI